MKLNYNVYRVVDFEKWNIYLKWNSGTYSDWMTYKLENETSTFDPTKIEVNRYKSCQILSQLFSKIFSL